MTYLTSVANGIADGGSTTHDSPSLTVSSTNKVMWVLVANSDSTPTTPSGVVWDPAGGAQALTLQGSGVTFGTFGNASLWRLIAPANATGVVRATWASGHGERAMVVWVETGIDQTTPNGTVAVANGTATTVSPGAVTTTAGQRVINLAQAIKTSVFSSSTPFGSPTGTERHDLVTSGTAYDAVAAQEQTASGSSTTPTWSMVEGGFEGWASFAFALNTGGGTSPAITAVSSATPSHGSTLTLTGTNFGASQGSGSVTIAGVSQTVTSWADTSIDITVDRSVSKYGVSVNVVVTDNALAASAPWALTRISPPSGWDYIDLTTPNTTATNRLTSTPDLASGDQIAYEAFSGLVVVASNATFSAANTVKAFQFEVWSPGGWGTTATQELLQPFSPAAINDAAEAEAARFLSLLDARTWGAPMLVGKWLADELAAAAAALAASASDAATAGDSASSVGTMATIAADAAAATDSASAPGVLVVAGTDAAATTDASTLQATIATSASDAAAATDSASSVSAVASTASDAAAATDAGTAQVAMAPGASDAATATDSSSSAATMGAAASDAVAPTDSTTNAITAGAAASDAVSASDSATSALGGGSNLSATDNAAASDAATQQATVSAAASDAAAPGDASTSQATMGASGTDSAPVTDAASLQGTVYNLSASESVAATDSSATQATRDISATEAVAPADFSATMGTFLQLAVDSIVIVDSAFTTAVQAVAGADAFSASDVAVWFGPELSEAFRYDVPAYSLRYDIPTAALRFDVPSIGSEIT